MSSVQLEVKTLRGKRPIVFAWNNPVKKLVECFLVSCPCQHINLPDTTKMATDINGAIMCDKKLATSLLMALAKADLFTHASLDNMESLLGFITDEQQEIPKKKKRKKRVHKEMPKRLKETSLALENKASVEKIIAATATCDDDAPSNTSEDGNTDTGANQDECDVNDSLENIDTSVHSITNNDEVNNLPLEKCLIDVSTSSGGFANNVDTPVQSVPSNDAVSNSQNADYAINGFETKRPSMNNSLLDIVDLENVDVVSAATITDSLASAVAERDYESGRLIEAIRSIIEVCPETDVTHHQDSPSINIVEDATSTAAIGIRTKVKFIRHLTDEERQKKFRFLSDVQRDNRRKLEGGSNAFLCHFCGKVLLSNCMKVHLRIHSDDSIEKNHVCHICGKTFRIKGGMQNHLKTHDVNRKLTCRYCPKSFRSISGRTNHERLHFDVYSDTCEQCGKKFVDGTIHRRHLETVHGVKPTIIVERKGRPNSLQAKITCQVCQKVIYKANERGHMAMHEGKMYTCNICRKVMAYSSKYYHIKHHQEGKCQPCTVCGKLVVYLTIHMRTHTGEKPIKCRYCDKRFAFHGARQSHEVVHTGLKPHKCTICDKSWINRGCYRIHMKKQHPGEPIQFKRRSSQINYNGKRTPLLEPSTSASADR